MIKSGPYNREAVMQLRFGTDQSHRPKLTKLTLDRWPTFVYYVRPLSGGSPLSTGHRGQFSSLPTDRVLFVAPARRR
jgi:hypothetical protein